MPMNSQGKENILWTKKQKERFAFLYLFIDKSEAKIGGETLRTSKFQFSQPGSPLTHS